MAATVLVQMIQTVKAELDNCMLENSSEPGFRSFTVVQIGQLEPRLCERHPQPVKPMADQRLTSFSQSWMMVHVEPNAELGGHCPQPPALSAPNGSTIPRPGGRK